jgi:hypothetical protein
MKKIDGELLYVLKYKRDYIICGSEIAKIEDGEVYLKQVSQSGLLNPIPYWFIEKHLIHIIGEYKESELPLS